MAKPLTRKFVCDLLPAKEHHALVFARSLSAKSFWGDKLAELHSKPDMLLKIRRDDASSLTQLRTKAKKLNISLAFAVDGEFVFIKCLILDGERKKLLMWLREPRTISELQALKLELALEPTLRDLSSDRIIALDKKNRWQLTEHGEERLDA